MATKKSVQKSGKQYLRIVPIDMRGGDKKLKPLIEKSNIKVKEGDAFIFLNKDRTIEKSLRYRRGKFKLTTAYHRSGYVTVSNFSFF